jgi:capsular polysaccharide biosynthesis protein
MNYPFVDLLTWLRKTDESQILLRKFRNFERAGDGIADIVRPGQLNHYHRKTVQPNFQYVLKIPQAYLFGKYGYILTPDHTVLRNSSLTGRCGLRKAESEYPLNADLHSAETLSGTVATITSEGAGCYFHWMLDILPRLHLLQNSGIDYDTLVTNRLQPFQRETLETLGVDMSRIIECGDHALFRAENLVFPSFISNTANNIDVTVDPAAMRWIARYFPSSKKPGLRLFISRSKVKYRNIVNEEELAPLLDSYGFQKIFPEDLTVKKQAELFGKASIILGAHGSAFTNMIFCPTETQIIEIAPPDLTYQHGLRSMARRLGLQSYIIVGRERPEDLQKDPLLSDIYLPVTRLEMFLRKLGIERACGPAIVDRRGRT